MSEDDLARRGAKILTEHGISDPQREARLLVRAAFPRRYVDFEAAMDGGMEETFFQMIARRCKHEPISHILGYRDFYEHRFYVNDDVLDPRPDTEVLVIAALEKRFSRVLDLGTGSGCILLSLLAACKDATGVGTDVSKAAMNVARRNIAGLELETRAELIHADWFQGVEGKFDLIVSNPPYITVDEMHALAQELSYEPRMALTDEADGLSAYRVIVPGAAEHLRPGGRLIVEIGWQQGADVSGLFVDAGFNDVQILPDLDGRDRVISGIWPK